MEADIAKALRTAAFVVGAIALAATGIGAAVGATGLFLGVAGATFTTIGTIAGVVGGVLSLTAAAVGAPKGTVGGNATKFKIDKEAGLPIVFGRTFVGGNVVHRQYYGSKNSLESWVTALSIGPVQSVGPLLIDRAEVTFIGGAAQGSYNGYMWLATQLGACPEPAALQGPAGAIPGWGLTSKLSGLAADLWTLKFDAKGKTYPNGVPLRGRVVEGVKAWDPRLDSTVLGGSGPCRLNDPLTHLYTESPWLLGLQFALGFVQNGTLIAGGGLPVTGIDLPRWIEAANYADLVGWKAGGLVYTTADNPWDILKMLAQAGGGEVVPVGGLLSCTFSAPRVSIGTIKSEDVIGDIDAPSTASMRVRRNTVIPRVRLESHGWEVVPLDAISVADYVAEDGAVRPREVELPLVQDADQGAQLSILKLLDDRELDGIVVPLKIYALGYLPGDCLTLDVPEANMFERDVILRTREIDAANLGVTFNCRTETPGKHAFALGQTGTPPPTPDLSVPGIDLSAPDLSDWLLTGEEVEIGGDAGGTSPALLFNGAVSNGNATEVLFSVGLSDDGPWEPVGTDPPDTIAKTVTGNVVAGGVYYGSVQYRVRGSLSERRVLGPVTAGNATAPNAATADTATTADTAAVANALGTYTPADIADILSRLEALEP